MSNLDLAAIQAKLAAPAGWGCDKECGIDEVRALLATTAALRDALRDLMAVIEPWQICDNWRLYSRPMDPCGACDGCKAYDAAKAALEAAEVRDGAIE
ncbi:MAG: hypothetical protein WC554_09815 [Clostridia bacterium]